MCYWQQEVLPVSLIAYWKLDEAEGVVAADRVGTNNATLVGDPLWRLAGGKLAGALQLDGIDDYVRTPFIVDPGKGVQPLPGQRRRTGAGDPLNRSGSIG
jgi:hypothetical protein